MAKDALQTEAVLVHFDPVKPLILACDVALELFYHTKWTMETRGQLPMCQGPLVQPRNDILSWRKRH